MYSIRLKGIFLFLFSSIVIKSYGKKEIIETKCNAYGLIKIFVNQRAFYMFDKIHLSENAVYVLLNERSTTIMDKKTLNSNFISRAVKSHGTFIVRE